ncbi:MAG TPA: biotin-dependent carboxyltransferase family protein [Flavobacteriaceae bacterium]|nr:biotin-dependent carboxyltransferase family protein [Flavobacteriaceae bacterium]
MAIEVLKPGLWTSIQDSGRMGFGNFGVPISGAMDKYAAAFANMLLGNFGKEAVMEITHLGPVLKFHEKTIAAISGLNADILLNGKKIPINESFQIEKGAVLSIERVSDGNWIYLAVFGGFQSEIIMDSRSMYDGITSQAKIKKGDFLKIRGFSGTKPEHYSIVRFQKRTYLSNRIKVFRGPEFSLLSKNNKNELFQKQFTISPDSSRMAYLLEEKVENNLQSILTGPVLPGTVELTPDGKLIILMRDAPVTGGYPRVLQVCEESLDVLAQKKTGEKIQFVLS